jgi:H+-transporting ATPase
MPDNADAGVTVNSAVAAPALPGEDGLSSAEAARRLAEFGPNAVAEQHVHPAVRVLRHFWSPVPWMLEATVALQVASGERLEAMIVAALLMVNVALAPFQEIRADAALALLRQRLYLNARVKRDGAWGARAAAELVPGDLVHIHARRRVAESH